jgi:hypothetical protein
LTKKEYKLRKTKYSMNYRKERSREERKEGDKEGGKKE